MRSDILAELRRTTKEMVDQLADLVRVESPSTDLGATASCAAAVDALGTALLGQAAERVVVEGRTHLRWLIGADGAGGAGGAAPPGVVLIGHFDTVWPLGTLARWPFSIEDGRATGPGAFDMKAGIVQMFHALSRIDIPEGRSLACVLTSDEEIGSPTSRSLIEETARGAGAALVLEPSAGGHLKIARKGTSMYQVRIAGRAAHAGLEPERGINATIELAHQVLAISGIGRPDSGTTVTPTVASAGTTVNTVPAAAALDVDVRATNAEEQERVDVEMRDLKPFVAGAEVRVEGGINRPPFPRSAADALFERAEKVAHRLGIEMPGGVEVGGGSDGNFTAGVGVPTLDGLGAVGDGAHAEGEHVVVDAMADRTALLAGLLEDLLAG